MCCRSPLCGARRLVCISLSEETGLQIVRKRRPSSVGRQPRPPVSSSPRSSARANARSPRLSRQVRCAPDSNRCVNPSFSRSAFSMNSNGKSAAAMSAAIARRTALPRRNLRLILARLLGLDGAQDLVAALAKLSLPWAPAPMPTIVAEQPVIEVVPAARTVLARRPRLRIAHSPQSASIFWPADWICQAASSSGKAAAAANETPCPARA